MLAIVAKNAYNRVQEKKIMIFKPHHPHQTIRQKIWWSKEEKIN